MQMRMSSEEEWEVYFCSFRERVRKPGRRRFGVMTKCLRAATSSPGWRTSLIARLQCCTLTIAAAQGWRACEAWKTDCQPSSS